MTSTQKQRILGAGVLIALVVIIVPFFMNDSSTQPQRVTMNTKLPQAPGIIIKTSSNSSEGFRSTPVANVTTEQNLTNEAVIEDLSPTTVSYSESETTLQPSEQNNGVTGDVVIQPPSSTTTVVLEPTPAVVVSPPTSAAPVAAPTSSRSVNSSKATKPTTVVVPKSSQGTISKTITHPNQLVSSASQATDVWLIQLGSFTQRTNAQSLVNQLRTNGYTAYMQDVDVSSGKVTRVYVGPIARREQADSLLNNLSQNLHLKGVIVSYQPAS